MTPPTTLRTAACRSCAAPIVWARSEAGKAMPLDAEPSPAGNVRVNAAGVASVMGPQEAQAWRDSGQPAHLSHFATCELAEEWRRG